ncbi:alpha/beta hydrolase [Paraconexibacter algicola]|uniref:alpha/beta hydrolase n=1 Tax=Paraconexibacter algicola TaxID=2133960 RepID=UPI0018EEB0C3|nr:alpha/beta hydrolase [Paraconexibacter algicola]
MSILLLLFGLLSVALVLNARRPRHVWWTILVRWPASWVARELTPLLVVGGLLLTALLAALGALDEPTGIVGAVLVLASATVGIAWTLTARGARVSVAGQVAELDLDDEDTTHRVPRREIALPLLMLRARDVRHVRGVPYTDDDERPRRLDVYLPREDPAPGVRRPAIVQVHGGGWVLGSRKEQGIPLLNHLARCGWVGFNIDYRLSPFATWPDHVVDVKRAIAWVREHADEYGVDPDFVAITGGSAGGHLSALAALTPNDPLLQPGFEDADTTVQAAVPFYGVYDFVDEERTSLPLLHPWVLEPLVLKRRLARDPDAFRAASPRHRMTADAPPMLVVHGDADSLIPVVQARTFVEELRAVSRAPVAYVELAGGEHAFDVIPSWRTAPVVETIERFLRTIHARRDAGGDRHAVEGDVAEALTE